MLTRVCEMATSVTDVNEAEEAMMRQNSMDREIAEMTNKTTLFTNITIDHSLVW